VEAVIVMFRKGLKGAKPLSEILPSHAKNTFSYYGERDKG